MVGVKYKYKGTIINGLEIISEPEKIVGSNSLFLKVLCKKCQKSGFESLLEISNSCNLPCECVRPNKVYKNKYKRTNSLFNYWMKNWVPETHKPNTYKLPYFSGSIGQEWVRGFTYVDKNTYYKWKNFMFIYSGYVKLNTTKDNIERGLGNTATNKFLHREVKSEKGLVTDHINRLKLDNRSDNLRPVSYSVNAANSKPRFNRKWKGVTYKSEKSVYEASIHSYKYYNLGSYKTIEAACIAYDLCNISLRGVVSYLNYPSSRYLRERKDLDVKVLEVLHYLEITKRGQKAPLNYSIIKR